MCHYFQLETKHASELPEKADPVEMDSDTNKNSDTEMDREDSKPVKEYGTIDDIFKSAEQEKLKVKQLEKKIKRQMAKEKRERQEARRLERKEEKKKLQKLNDKSAKKSKKKADSDDSESSDEDSDVAVEEGPVDGTDDNRGDEGELMTSLERKNKLEHFAGNYSEFFLVSCFWHFAWDILTQGDSKWNGKQMR